MNARVKTLWLEALRSGKFIQGRHRLRSITQDKQNFAYCCLGVLCELHAEESQTPWAYCAEDNTFVYLNNTVILPPEVAKWAEFRSVSPKLGLVTLVKMNDDGYSFEQIADKIEQFL